MKQWILDWLGHHTTHGHLQALEAQCERDRKRIRETEQRANDALALAEACASELQQLREKLAQAETEPFVSNVRRVAWRDFRAAAEANQKHIAGKP